MALQYNTISEITNNSMNWNLKVRIVHFWTTPDKYKPDISYSMELILQDEKGDRIHASIDKYTIKYFRDKIYDHGLYRMKYFVIASYHSKFKSNSHKHKLTFTQNTIVTKLEDSSFHMDVFKLCTFDEVVIQHNTDENQLIDVVGHVVSYEPIQLSKQGDNSSSFMNIVVEDEKKNNLPATLWGDLAFQMQSHLSGSTDEPLIVVLQLMKTHKFRDTYSIRSCWYQTKLWINTDLPQSSAFKNKLIASGEYEKVSQTSSQQHISISEELSTGMVSFKFIKDFLQCTEESTYWIAVKIVCLELGHKWSYLACKKCITKVDPMGDKYYCLKCNVEVISVIHRYRLQIHVTDETGFISLLLWNKEVLQLIGKTAKELKEGLIGDADNGYPTELDTLIEKKLMFKVQIKDSNINKNDNVYKVVKVIDDEALLKEYCHPSLIHSLTEASLDCEQSIDEDKLIETPIKNSISDCVSSQIEDVIDLTEKLYPNNGKQVGVRPTHADDEGLNVKLPSNKLRKVIKKEKKA